MSNSLFSFNPFAFQAACFKAMVDTSLDMQTRMLEKMQARAPAPEDAVKWVKIDMPIPRLVPEPDALREAFHKSAERNLRKWETVANVLQAMPAFTKIPSEVPGRLMVDAFDKMRRSAVTGQTPAGQMLQLATSAAAAMMPAPVPANDDAMTVAGTDDVPVADTGAADDLTAIKGIGPKLAAKLTRHGIRAFDQIAAWSKDDAAQMDDAIDGKGRIARDNWVKQARKLAKAAA